MQITVHHLKMLPVYLLANVLLTTAFIHGLKSGKLPMHLFGTSMLIWSISLLVVGIVLYNQIPGWKTFAGFGLLLIGVYVIQMDIGR